MSGLPLPAPAFAVDLRLPGWELLWALLERTQGEPPGERATQEELATLRADSAAAARGRFASGELAAHPVIAELRRLFRAAGTDPTRYRPSSEALLRRLLKGDEIPAISPLVDLNNCLSARLGAPCCVMDESAVTPPYVLRAGAPGEEYESLRGPFRLEGRPLLVDAHGPCDAPITGSRRVMVTEETAAAWLVAYLPAEAIRAERAAAELEGLLASCSAVGGGSVAASR